MINLPAVLPLIAIALIIMWLSRSMPLTGTRRVAVILLRIVGIGAAVLAARGLAYSTPHTQPRHIIYLVDQSASIDPRQTAWMARRLASLEALRPAQVSRTLTIFGQDAQLAVPIGHERLLDPSAIQRMLEDASIQREETNLETALLASVATVSSPQRSRVVLLSDGRQTMGDVERIVPHIRRFGLEVYPVNVPSTIPTGVVWEELAAPSIVKRGTSVPVKLIVSNGTERTQVIEIEISVSGLPVKRKRVKLPPGWQALSIPVSTIKTGTMALEVSVTTSSSAEPQRRMAMVEVEGPPKLLFVLEKPAQLPLLAAGLKRREMDLSVATPAELPSEAGALLEYDAVVLFQLPKSVIAPTQVDALRQYVERFGGGVTMVGLGGVLHDEVTHPAALDALLPLVFEPKGLQESKRRVCVILLIDRSASMMGPRIAATKRAAVELVKQLAAEDLVGVLAFDTVPYVIVEVQQVRQVQTSLIDKLVRLKSVGGTDILPALRAAQERLEMTGATVKHAILLSDGQTPFERLAYQQQLAQFTQHQISLSTIGIGPAMVNTELLGWLAKETGGTFYQLRNLEDLPRLVVLDTEKALGRLPFTEGYFQPKRSEQAVWFEDVSDWPPLKGYFTTSAKPSAEIELMIPQDEVQLPLLAHWTMGKGRVAAFASDAQPRWSPDWVRWHQFERVWSEIIQRTMRPRPTEELFAWVETNAGSPHLVIEGDLRQPTASLVSQDGREMTPLALVQHGQFRWRASVDHVGSGWHQLVVESDSAFLKRWIQIGQAQRGAEAPHLPPDESLLRHIAQDTAGVFDVPDRAFLPPTERVTVQVPLQGMLLPLVILLLLIDVAIRGRTML
ncbi:MAG: VWA domain-containing protein [Candidatus Omnitrophica bacterium]|nr:VWA domain-containing protein [Candidatus Omnitrophota bacterium]